ncbi:hypothetical protein HPU229336_07475 [Helicobacter pullorum]|uniref:Uncharacterized protein n=1 Tax=Helicobacter pullorum TaxID=35818 RepID=A0AAW3J5Y8_9HELI|nr:hypothetical protein [Helicobacter pullorum]KPH51464.1 hypothetical protein HPU229336_07475 [Helicobacter pullorum]
MKKKISKGSGEGFYFSTPNHYRIKFSDSGIPQRVTIITQETQIINGEQNPRNCAFSCNLTQEEKAFLIKFINEDTEENLLEVKEGKLYYSHKENLE